MHLLNVDCNSATCGVHAGVLGQPVRLLKAALAASMLLPTHLHDRVRAGAFRVGSSAACAAVGIAVLHQLLDDVLVIHLDFLHIQSPLLCMTVISAQNPVPVHGQKHLYAWVSMSVWPAKNITVYGQV